jgi:hypothetical protein
MVPAVKIAMWLYGIPALLISSVLLPNMYSYDMSVWVWQEFEKTVLRKGIHEAIFITFLYLICYSFLIFASYLLLTRLYAVDKPYVKRYSIQMRLLLSVWIAITFLMIIQPLSWFFWVLSSSKLMRVLVLLWVPSTILAFIYWREMRIMRQADDEEKAKILEKELAILEEENFLRFQNLASAEKTASTSHEQASASNTPKRKGFWAEQRENGLTPSHMAEVMRSLPRIVPMASAAPPLSAWPPLAAQSDKSQSTRLEEKQDNTTVWGSCDDGDIEPFENYEKTEQDDPRKTFLAELANDILNVTPVFSERLYGNVKPYFEETAEDLTDFFSDPEELMQALVTSINNICGYETLFIMRDYIMRFAKEYKKNHVSAPQHLYSME